MLTPPKSPNSNVFSELDLVTYCIDKCHGSTLFSISLSRGSRLTDLFPVGLFSCFISVFLPNFVIADKNADSRPEDFFSFLEPSCQNVCHAFKKTFNRRSFTKISSVVIVFTCGRG